ncbi:hypothetical protein KCM76_15000 [Zooshikella marina]|uniref:hypothetical protein n=1 Tax=Zooshikella ganghwensis TaxID=202772 RepID=UPI001BAFFFEE|nr:hypothetical protein [Zooshikella ganghwensis]MBU2707302.1 hypothetical protein [Zooshikella ganghwensis]
MAKKYIIFLFFTFTSLLIFFLYSSAITNFFVLDDETNLIVLKNLDNPVVSWWDIAFSNTSGFFSRPIAMITFAFDYYLYGYNFAAYKITNIVIHIINSVLVFFIIRHYLQCFELNNIYLISMFTTLLWVLSPMHLSSVVYVIQRMNLLAAFFMLVAVLYYFLFLSCGRYKFYKIIFIYVICLISLLAKENGVTVLLIIALTEIIFMLSGKSDDKKLSMKLLIALFTPILIGVCYLFLKWDYFTIEGYRNRDFNYLERLITQVNVVCDYMFNLVFPLERNMGIFFDNYKVYKCLFCDGWTVLKLITFIVISFFLFRFEKVALWGWGWYLMGLSLESSIFSLEMYFEHRNYFPSVGIYFLIAYFLFKFLNVAKYKRSIYSLYCLYLLLFCLVLYTRANVWRSMDSLAVKEYERNPGSSRASVEMSNYYMRYGDIKKGLHVLNKISKREELKFGYGFHMLALACNNVIEVDINKIEKKYFSTDEKQEAMYYMSAIKNLAKVYNKKRCKNLGLDEVVYKLNFDNVVKGVPGFSGALSELFFSLGDMFKYEYYAKVAYINERDKIGYGLRYVKALYENDKFDIALLVLNDLERKSKRRLMIFMPLINQYRGVISERVKDEENKEI